MGIKVVLCPDDECVYYVSGTFFEGSEFETQNDSVLTITVMPLKLKYVPYTFRLIGGSATGGKALSCECDGKYYVKIGMQSMLLFADGKDAIPADNGSRFFRFVRDKMYGEALKMLSGDFKLTDDDLQAFFNGFIADIKQRDYYILIDSEHKGHRCFLTEKDGKIDNISIE